MAFYRRCQVLENNKGPDRRRWGQCRKGSDMVIKTKQAAKEAEEGAASATVETGRSSHVPSTCTATVKRKNCDPLVQSYPIDYPEGDR